MYVYVCVCVSQSQKACESAFWFHSWFHQVIPKIAAHWNVANLIKSVIYIHICMFMYTHTYVHTRYVYLLWDYVSGDPHKCAGKRAIYTNLKFCFSKLAYTQLHHIKHTHIFITFLIVKSNQGQRSRQQHNCV